MAIQKYKQKCNHCNYEWLGKKPFPVSCPRCKHRTDIINNAPPGRSAALKFIEFNLISAGIHPEVAHLEAKRRLNLIIGFGGNDGKSR